MNFLVLSSSVGKLKTTISTFISEKPLSNINVSTPINSNDELSFYKLIAWCYCLLYEAGKVNFSFFFKNLPPEFVNMKREDHLQTYKLIQILRTWLFHNLGFNDHDKEFRVTAFDWFVDTCGNPTPSTSEEWELCFNRICDIVTELVNYNNDILNTALKNKDTRDGIINIFLIKIERDWPAHKFHSLIEDSAARLGITHINAKSFADTRMTNWKKFLDETSEESHINSTIERLVDQALIEHQKTLSPVSTKELMAELSLDPGPDVSRAVQIANEGFHQHRITDKDKLFKYIKEQLAQP